MLPKLLSDNFVEKIDHKKLINNRKLMFLVFDENSTIFQGKIPFNN